MSITFGKLNLTKQDERTGVNMRKKWLWTMIAFLGFSFGIALQIKADVGQSMFNAFAMSLTKPFEVEIGTVINGLNVVFFILYIAIRRTALKLQDGVQLGAVMANGFLINLYLYRILGTVTFTSYGMRMAVLVVGIALASISLGAILAMNLVRFPLESLCLTLESRYLKWSFSKIRQSFDGAFLVGALLMPIIFKTPFYIREGTVISFVLLSQGIGHSLNWFRARA